jgi:hypothetical protein
MEILVCFHRHPQVTPGELASECRMGALGWNPIYLLRCVVRNLRRVRLLRRHGHVGRLRQRDGCVRGLLLRLLWSVRLRTVSAGPFSERRCDGGV